MSQPVDDAFLYRHAWELWQQALGSGAVDEGDWDESAREIIEAMAKEYERRRQS